MARRNNEPEPVAFDGEMIRLGQFLKLANLIDSGGEAKAVIAEGLVLVNGENEFRRGRQLHDGDVIEIDGRAVRAVSESPNV